MNRLSGMWLLQIVILMFYVTSISCIVQEASNLNLTHSTTIPMLRMAKKKDPVSPALQNEGYNIVKRLAREFTSNYFQRYVRYEFMTSVLSPLTTFITVSMLSYGGLGYERNPFLSTIGLHKSASRIAKYGYKRLIDTLSNYNIKLSTKVYYTADLAPTTYFTNLAQNFFNADLEPVSADVEYISNEKVNDWVKSQTNNESRTPFGSFLKIGPNPSIALVTAVYFKGGWESPFDSSLTTQRPFYIFDFHAVNVPTMHKFARMPYGRIDSIRANFVELAYKRNGRDDVMSMFIILPDSIMEVDLIAREWDKVNWEQLYNTTMRYVSLYLPKFKLEYSHDVRPPSDYGYPLNRDAYWDKHSTFEHMMTPIKTMSFGTGAIKFVIDVNEEGNTASGSSGVFYTKVKTGRYTRHARSTHVEKAVQFEANRSFFAIIATKGRISENLFIIKFNGSPFISLDVPTSE